MADARPVPAWERQQMKTFTNWVNMYLSRCKEVSLVKDIAEDFADSIRLGRLLDAILADMSDAKQKEYGRASLKKYIKKPKMEIQKIENLNAPINIITKFCEESNIRISIGALDILQGNKRVILGMIWILISKFAIDEISEEQQTAKDGLLLWCKKKTKGYAHVNVTNFNFSFQNGMAFCALIHKHRPDLIDFAALDPEDKAGNLKLAFETATSAFAIHPLLEADDMVDSKPDDKSVMTYVAYYWKAFQQYAQTEVAARRVSKVVGKEMSIQKKRDDFESQASEVRSWASEKASEFLSTVEEVESLNAAEVLEKLAQLEAYQEEDKPSMASVKDKNELGFRSIQARLQAEKRARYQPSAGCDPRDVEAEWEALGQAEQQFEVACRTRLVKVKQLASHMSGFLRKMDSLLEWAARKQEQCSIEAPSESLDAIVAAIKKHMAFDKERVAYVASFVVRAEQQSEALKLQVGSGDAVDQIEVKMATVHEHFEQLEAGSESLMARLKEEEARHEEMDKARMEWVRRAMECVFKIEETKNSLSGELVAGSLAEVAEFEAQHAQVQLDVQELEGSDLGSLEAYTEELSAMGIHDNPYAPYDISDIRSMVATELAQLVEERGENIEEERQKQQDFEDMRTSFVASTAECERLIKAAADELGSLYAKSMRKAKAEKKKKAQIERTGSGRSMTMMRRDKVTVESLTEPLTAYDYSAVDACLGAVNEAYARLVEANVTSSAHTGLTPRDLAYMFENTKDQAVKNREEIERMVRALPDNDLTDEEMAELQGAFRFFDKDKSGALGKMELVAVLQTFDMALSDEEVDAAIAQFDVSGDGELQFEEFIQLVMEQKTDSESPEQIIESFREIAGGASTINRQQLSMVLDPEEVDFLLANMTSAEAGYDGPEELCPYDFDSFIDVAFGDALAEASTPRPEAAPAAHDEPPDSPEGVDTATVPDDDEEEALVEALVDEDDDDADDMAALEELAALEALGAEEDGDGDGDGADEEDLLAGLDDARLADEAADADADADAGVEGAVKFTALMYALEDETPSEELDMAAVLEHEEQGIINDDTLVWCDGMEGWTALGDCRELFTWPSSRRPSPDDDDDLVE